MARMMHQALLQVPVVGPEGLPRRVLRQRNAMNIITITTEIYYVSL